jgi:hypothetical protein
MKTIDKRRPVILYDHKDHTTFSKVHGLLSGIGYEVSDDWPIVGRSHSVEK